MKTLEATAGPPEDEGIDPPSYEYEMPDQGRLILHTIHGTVYIDVRAKDVNAFTLIGLRADKLLIPPR